jgi:hypothetical protein
LLVSVEAILYPLTAERLEAMGTAKSKKFLEPISFEPIEILPRPTYPIEMKEEATVIHSLTELTETHRRYKKKLRRVRKDLAAYTAWEQQTQQLAGLFKNDCQGSYEDIAAVIVADLGRYMPVLIHYWKRCEIEDTNALMYKGAKEGDMARLLALQYLRACDMCKLVEEKEDEASADDLGIPKTKVKKVAKK